MSSKSEELYNMFESHGEPTKEDHDRYHASAHRMVDSIEKRRRKGKFTKEEREELAQKFHDNMARMKRGELKK